MKRYQSIKLQIYSYLKEKLNPKLFDWLGRSTLLKPIRKRLFYTSNQPTLVCDRVSFEKSSFFFEAPIKIMEKASRNGIEARICRVAMAHLNQGSIAIDVGANYGFITMVMAKTVQETGKVFSFESNNDIFKVLNNSVKKNNFESRCILTNQYVGQPEESGFITLDEIILPYKFEKIDFLKIDVDGGDFAVLLGAKRLLSHYHPSLVVEMEKNQIKIYNFLKDLGYQYFIGMEGENVTPPTFPPNLFASFNHLFIPARGSLS